MESIGIPFWLAYPVDDRGTEKLAKKYHYPVVSQKPIIASDVWYELNFYLISMILPTIEEEITENIQGYLSWNLNKMNIGFGLTAACGK